MQASGERWAWVGLALLLLAFVGVSQRLFSSRYWAGDVYPSFSSLNSTPNGTRALYEALAALPRRDVVRNNRPLARLADQQASAPATTFVVAGWPAWRLDGGASIPEALDRLASAGGRVVLAVAAEEEPEPAQEEPLEADDDDEVGDDDATEEEAPVSERELEALRAAAERADRWAFELREAGEDAATARLATEERGGLPAEILWRSPFSLAALGDAWEVLYAVDGAPVLVERPLGENGGSIVLAAGNFFLTNRAQSEDRQVELLVRVVGVASRIVFDEAHLGLVSTPGVVALGKRYRLHGVALALATVLGLALWRGLSRLIPPPTATARRPTEARGSREGLNALLRRGIPRGRLLAVCVEQWSAVSGRDQVNSEALRITREADPVDGYRRLSELLEPQKRSR